jgi:hypothetical protein
MEGSRPVSGWQGIEEDKRRESFLGEKHVLIDQM